MNTETLFEQFQRVTVQSLPPTSTAYRPVLDLDFSHHVHPDEGDGPSAAHTRIAGVIYLRDRWSDACRYWTELLRREFIGEILAGQPFYYHTNDALESRWQWALLADLGALKIVSAETGQDGLVAMLKTQVRRSCALMALAAAALKSPEVSDLANLIFTYEPPTTLAEGEEAPPAPTPAKAATEGILGDLFVALAPAAPLTAEERAALHAVFLGAHTAAELQIVHDLGLGPVELDGIDYPGVRTMIKHAVGLVTLTPDADPVVAVELPAKEPPVKQPRVPKNPPPAEQPANPTPEQPAQP